MSVSYFTQNISFKYSEKRKTSSLVSALCKLEGFNTGQISIIFCCDNYLLDLNKKYLFKSHLTDIITFNYNFGKTISGDLFISIDKVRENSIICQVPFEIELKRVIIHGVLHLVGYNDSSIKEKKIMRAKEDFYLSV